MATRYVYCTADKSPYYTEIETEFQFFGGFSEAQKKRCIDSLHESFLKNHPDAKVLEISSKGRVELGNNLSAFNLTLKDDLGERTVEVLFQGSKVFRVGMGNERFQPTKIYDMTSREAKKAIKEYYDLEQPYYTLDAFKYKGIEFPLEPKNYFYNWLYLSALESHPDLAEAVMSYDSFTDIEFNPKKAFNCQAIAVAIYVGLKRNDKLEDAMKSPADFLRIVYGV